MALVAGFPRAKAAAQERIRRQVKDFFLQLVKQTNDTNCWEQCAPSDYKRGQHEVVIGAWINDLAALNVEESHLRIDAYVWIR